MTTKIVIVLNQPQTDLLDELLMTGLYGTSITEVAERLINEGLRCRMAPGGKMSPYPLDRAIQIKAI